MYTYLKKQLNNSSILKNLTTLSLILITSLVMAQDTNIIEDGHHDHKHKQIEVPENVKTPQLQAHLYPDLQSGYNLHLELINYQIQPPELANDANKDVINGHAHLYINDEKIGRLYGPYSHIPKNLIQTGFNRVTVTLNNHQHDTWAINNTSLTTSVTLNTHKKNPIIKESSSSPISNAK